MPVHGELLSGHNAVGKCILASRSLPIVFEFQLNYSEAWCGDGRAVLRKRSRVLIVVSCQTESPAGVSLSGYNEQGRMEEAFVRPTKNLHALGRRLASFQSPVENLRMRTNPTLRRLSTLGSLLTPSPMALLRLAFQHRGSD